MYKISIDFEKDEALYIQISNEILIGILENEIKIGEALPSVRSLAEELQVNFHTVNKAYANLRELGIVIMSSRQGAMIKPNLNKEVLKTTIKSRTKDIVALALCHQMDDEELHSILDEIIKELKK